MVLSFDEMACSELVKYHKGLDIVLGPNKEMQVIMVRGLSSKFKQPIYIDFDTVVTKSNLLEVILMFFAYNLVRSTTLWDT